MLLLKKKGISSPIDSKRYLFKINSPFDRKIELVTNEQLKKTNDSFIKRG